MSTIDRMRDFCKTALNLGSNAAELTTSIHDPAGAAALKAIAWLVRQGYQQTQSSSYYLGKPGLFEDRVVEGLDGRQPIRPAPLEKT